MKKQVRGESKRVYRSVRHEKFMHLISVGDAYRTVQQVLRGHRQYKERDIDSKHFHASRSDKELTKDTKLSSTDNSNSSLEWTSQ